MTAQRHLNITPLQAFFFTVALALALIAVLVPVLPGDVHLEAGDRAYKTFEVAGETIAREGEPLSAEQIARVRAAGQLENELTASATASAILVSIVSAALLGLYLHLFQPREVSNPGRLLLVGLLTVLWVAAAKIFLSLLLPGNDRIFLAYILPMAAAPMLVAALLDGGLGLAVAGLLAVLATFAGFYMPDARLSTSTDAMDTLTMALAFVLAGVTGVFAVRRAERLNHYVVAGIHVALVLFVVLLAFWLITPDREGIDLLWMLAAAALGGVGSAVITVGGIVVLGVLFGVTTRMQLMELAQLSHPLLRELQEKAPGTFHHSVIVGNLAERAADVIGADALLVRVGCYFHDIGKIAAPGYYIENQLGVENPHDRLQPAASAKLVTQHVTAGHDLTGRHHVPASVRAFVREHHGTRLVTYFYRRASEQDPNVDAEKFRYPGPKPQTKETAIVMLADSVEAVVRANRDRSHDKIDALADNVIAERVSEGQLDECDLTLRELKTVAESFKATLRGIYHPRIEYPEPTKAELEASGRHTPVGYLRPPIEPIEAPPLEG